MSFFISKEFKIRCLDTADYWRCTSCGFVISKTHVEMAPQDWETLNHDIHSDYQGTEIEPRDPRWFSRLQKQAAMLNDAQEIGLLDKKGRWVDYACGDGKISDFLRVRYGVTLQKFEKYMPTTEGYLKEADLVPGTFDFVMSTAVFEHLWQREAFDFIESLVTENGVLGLHTLVCDQVPEDSTWFYLIAVHCAFHTNKSMQVLFEQWGYTSSVYHVESQFWLFFKNDPDRIEAIVKQANQRPDGHHYEFKRAFVDYWKVQPYRADPAEN